jgi:multidrug resistance efflux pump
MKKRLLFLLPVVLISVAVIWQYRARSSGDATDPSLQSDTFSTLETEVVERGVLEAITLAPVLASTSGVLAELVEDGTRVKKGQVLARMDDEEIRNKMEAEQEALEQEKENLEAETQELEVIMSQYEAVSRLEKAELAHAELVLKHGKVPLTPEELRLEEIGIELAELDLKDVQDQWNRQKELVAKQFAPGSSAESLQREVLAAETFLKEKKLQLALKRQPLPEEEQLSLEYEVRKAKEIVRRSHELHEQELSIQQLKLEGIRIRIQNSEEQIERYAQQIKDVNIRAPADGVFLLIQNYSWGAQRWESISVGENVWEMDSIGSIIDPENLQLHVLIHESDIRRVHPGMQAKVELTAYPEKILSASLETITEMGQDRDDLSPIHRQAPPVNQALFLAKLELTVPEDIQVMPGMTAIVRIQMGDEQ